MSIMMHLTGIKHPKLVTAVMSSGNVFLYLDFLFIFFFICIAYFFNSVTIMVDV